MSMLFRSKLICRRSLNLRKKAAKWLSWWSWRHQPTEVTRMPTSFSSFATQRRYQSMERQRKLWSCSTFVHEFLGIWSCVSETHGLSKWTFSTRCSTCGRSRASLFVLWMFYIVFLVFLSGYYFALLLLFEILWISVSSIYCHVSEFVLVGLYHYRS